MNNRIETVKTIRINGNSLSIHLTKELRLMGLGPGDAVQITLKRLDTEEATKKED